ncbi:regulatory protein [Streptomyces sp. AcH 505]|uniref:AfsR/SARP family transcriptional regulator n=1 Tax=unclassified Streptomyces TaxID=2593676 RepID=UPI00059210C7|nr:AfsR/SARP family transcriptional regulator [Streptomyces sp. NBC_00370]KIF66515.1 regulatory protein [Streptomyces sp. AcH 505]
MEITLLGSLNAQEDGSPILPSAAKTRQILALLALHANQVVPVSMLMEELWEYSPPRTASATLQTYILRLRRLIDASVRGRCDAKEILVYKHDGYRLNVPRGSVDAMEYDRLAAEGQRVFESGDDAAAVRIFRESLQLWSGPALADIRPGALLEIERVRLEESRLGVLERRVDAELSLGRHSELLTELTVLTARNPLHEGLHAQRMIALYRSGRPSEALGVFMKLRGRLVEDLGLDPSPRLQRLQRAILGGDVDLDQTYRGPGRRVLDMYAA